jgi:hypothetical protein
MKRFIASNRMSEAQRERVEALRRFARLSSIGLLVALLGAVGASTAGAEARRR